MQDWRLEYERIIRQNEQLVKEIRNLRCVMVEAAGSINPSAEPVLFSQLMGSGQYFVDDRCNPYPEHDDLVSDQYMAALAVVADSFESHDSAYAGAEEFVLPIPHPGYDENGEF